MKLTNKIALDAAINAVYVLRYNGVKDFRIEGTHDMITANEIIHKLYEMYENEPDEQDE